MANPITPCPCCGSGRLAPFYALRGIPVQSNALLTSRQQAIEYPRGDLSLAFCAACGFIANTLFDPAIADQHGGYEATQAFSSTFNAFTKKLAAAWISRFDLTGKHLLEIGCGQGEFIALLTTMADASGIGIDPHFDPARHPAPGDGRLSFVRDLYSPAYAHLPADFICCRHTLEHIPNVNAFLRSMRNAIGERPNVDLGFEVPDTLRALREGAFWDIYYEHCSYFTPGSLARVFRANRFDVTDLRLEYDGQYLILDATSASGPTGARVPMEDDLSATSDAVSQFTVTFTAASERWKSVVNDAVAEGKRVALWGSGSKAVGFLTTLGLRDDRVGCVVDINPHKQGTFLPVTAQPIVAPEYLRTFRPDIVIVMNPIYREEIGKSINALGLTVRLLTL